MAEEVPTHGVQLVALAFVGGFVDAISYLGLGHVFTANMTGNTVLLGIALGRLQAAAAMRAVIALVGFCVGVIAASTLARPRSSLPPRHKPVWIALACESLLLSALAALWLRAGTPLDDATQGSFIAMASACMGIQSEAARMVGIPGVATTYITGTLTTLTAKLAEWCHLTIRREDSATDNASPAPAPAFALSRAPLLATIWAIYLAGAGISAFLEPRGLSWQMFLPAAIVGAVALTARTPTPGVNRRTEGTKQTVAGGRS
jgi:uncharacterized membrane protein YoaK (UPF0700 family)